MPELINVRSDGETSFVLRDRRWVAIVGWSAAAAFTSLAIVALMQNALLAGVAFLALGLLGLVLVLSAGSTLLNDRGIARHTGFGRFGMRWEEIRSLETDGMTWVLRGVDKHLPIVPSHWAGPERQRATQFLVQRFEATGLSTTRSRAASYRLPRNVRIHRSSPAT
jgi:hypothetical protein